MDPELYSFGVMLQIDLQGEFVQCNDGENVKFCSISKKTPLPKRGGKKGCWIWETKKCIGFSAHSKNRGCCMENVVHYTFIS